MTFVLSVLSYAVGLALIIIAVEVARAKYFN